MDWSTFTPDDLTAPPPATGAVRPPPSRSLLERLLSPLDWGRQAVVNFGQGVGDLGDGHFRSGLAKMAPGIGGILAGALTGGVAAPFVGTGLASLLQGAGNEISPDTMRAMSTSDLLTRLGGDPDSDLQNIALGAATDPWTYAFGLGGIAGGSRRLASVGDRVGGRIGEQVGQRLEAAQLSLGPRYSTSGADLMRMLDGASPGADNLLQEIIGADFGREPHVAEALARRIGQEIPEGSVSAFPFGRTRGSNAFFKSPTGDFIKVSPHNVGTARPVTEGLVQPFRSAVADLGGVGELNIERMPYASALPATEGEVGNKTLEQALAEFSSAERQKLSVALRGEGPSVFNSSAPPTAAEVLGPAHHLSYPVDKTERALRTMMHGPGAEGVGPRMVLADWLEEQGRPIEAMRSRQSASLQELLAGDGLSIQDKGLGLSHNPERYGLVNGEMKALSPGDIAPILPDPVDFPGTLREYHAVEDEARRAIPRVLPIEIAGSAAPMPSLIIRKMLDGIGGQDLIRKALAAGHQDTGITAMMKRMGQMAGSMGGHAAGGLVGASAGAIPLLLRDQLGY